MRFRSGDWIFARTDSRPQATLPAGETAARRPYFPHSRVSIVVAPGPVAIQDLECSRRGGQVTGGSGCQFGCVRSVLLWRRRDHDRFLVVEVAVAKGEPRHAEDVLGVSSLVSVIPGVGSSVTCALSQW